MDSLAYGLVDAPWGPVHVAASGRAVVAVAHLVPTDDFIDALRRRSGFQPRSAVGRADGAARRVEAASAALDEYFRGARRSFDLSLDLGRRPDWDVAVLEGVRQVPWGHVTSYGRVARRIGRPGAARAVGGAVGRNPIGILVPCHRVVAGDGSLGGYGGDWFGSREALLEIKRELLRLEGVRLPASDLVD